MKNSILDSDAAFDAFYPEAVRIASEFHFTPVAVAKAAAAYLVDAVDTKVLDVGSGAGKFCIVGASTTEGVFTGVELRESLHDWAMEYGMHLQLERLLFLHSDIMNVDFRAFDAIYLFNPFYENIDKSGKINTELRLERQRYDLYSLYVKLQLALMPLGTKLATYFSYGIEIPKAYVEVGSSGQEKLRFWEKML